MIWFKYYQIIPKAHRHTLGQQVDTLWIEIIKTLATATFIPRQDKLPYVRLAIQKVDTLKVLLMILWEAGSLQNEHYVSLSIPIEEIGKNLGGWSGQLEKQNSPTSPNGKTGKK
ncbi:MAG: hypothetical protein A2655_01180 [Candidatus Yanofskybacteria bacterium RIFCSPHIGHO2_01_FULL_43_42]|uniref:Four helix bundle protein n=1 Tax=Candidatus Yanofskybacteria bacterium RIFCSPLOWO2_01_FULL_43_22 TaxID=1802695 RepID=A0A1F8GET0_9BACT|nr:MAG: hypothetical protein A2655_01180 [Candidatus Yanofskybacteria bacterium RIFCSPHIGHO2_01_FULL_43_42]OGN12419.1 MAG: hypothetical protein A3D48_01910 [Candidatus Yanofskybacteria bacterium RIFCSPHIGHO2_02_FULL_43_17]OGN23791.1 MAG: hypothetical protein A3A13_01970 [Candidatus Yanofskybacteria bacterium RIFCSPLOWO2_01_FULL_43_22]